MKTYKTYICNKKLERKRFILFIIIVDIITKAFSLLFLIASLIALCIYFSKKTFKNYIFYIYSIFLYVTQIISLVFNFFASLLFLFFYFKPEYIENEKIHQKFYFLIFILLDLLMLFQIWKIFIVKQFYDIMVELKKNNFDKKQKEDNGKMVINSSFESSHGFDNSDLKMISTDKIDHNESIDFSNFVQNKDFK